MTIRKEGGSRGGKNDNKDGRRKLKICGKK